jgi:hypothetical protein
MIREFKMDDLEKISTNEFSDISEYKELLSSTLIKKHTFEKNEILCIIGYYEYWCNNYNAFLIISDKFDKSDAKELKEFIHGKCKELNAQRLETRSQDIEVLNRWHEFLGFEEEGTLRKFMKNKDYKMWGMLFLSREEGVLSV